MHITACLYWYHTVCEALKTSEDTMTLRHVSQEPLSELQRNSLPASFFYCGWNKVVVMQCHDGRETKGNYLGECDTRYMLHTYKLPRDCT